LKLLKKAKARSKSKRALDVILSSFGIVMLIPIWLAVIISIRIESRGKALFRQERVGQQGKPFVIYKFRTMIQGAQLTGSGLYSFERDPRITRIGARLRQWSLDETPQLINVLRGNMSIVGPRPPVIGELETERTLPENYEFRFSVLPGITGLAQISGRNSLTWNEKIQFDLAYVEKFKSLGVILDLSIIFKTIYIVISRQNVIEKEKNNDQL
jgi:undecaprenyl phosphate N,N'-diacetylbacillosamine 1-phosphate transferase